MTIIEKPNTEKQARLGLRLTEEHKARIERAAALTGQTVNSFAASGLLRLSDEILEKEERRLTNTARDRFLALLDSDEEPADALKAAADEYKTGRVRGATYHFEL